MTTAPISPDLTFSFDTRAISRHDLDFALYSGDIKADAAFGKSKRDIRWNGQVMEVTWLPDNPFLTAFNQELETARTEINQMSITGYQPGSIQAKLAAIKQKASDGRAAALAKLDQASVNNDSVNAEIERLAAQVQKEADDALAEFAQFTNGAPE